MRIKRAAIMWVLGFLGVLDLEAAQVRRTQTIQLKPGWNSVFLEVQPDERNPEVLFSRLPVDTVACFALGPMQGQFIRNPGDAPWREEGWTTWHAATKAESFLSTISEVQAQRPLLVQAREAVTWTVTGEATATSLTWYPDTCTFTGLPVDPDAPPTFAQFFEGSAAHQRLRIYRLLDGAWKLVSKPAMDRVRAGEAYWIQTDGGSAFQGPLRLKLSASGGIHFDTSGGVRALEFINESRVSTAMIQVESLGLEGLPMRRVEWDFENRRTVRTALPKSLALPALEAKASALLRVEPDRDAMPGQDGAVLLRVRDGRGTQIWVPIQARRSMPVTAQP